MASELDILLDQSMDALTAPGGMLALAHVDRNGQPMPLIAAAPPSLAHMFAHFCAVHGDKEFLVDGELRLSFADSYAAARTVAGALVAGHGVVPGDRIGIAARNSANWVIAYMAVIMAGGVATLLNGWWQGPEMADAVRLVDCKLVLADAARAERLRASGAQCSILPFAHDVPPREGLAALLAKGGGADTVLPDLGGENLATILFTSGSTGVSKGAYSDHRGVVQGTFNYVAQTMMVLDIMTKAGNAPTAQPSTLLNVPLFHVTAEVPVLLQSFVIGRKLVLMPKWDAELAMRLIEREGVTYFVGVPLMSYEMATHPKRREYDLSTCVTFAAGGAPRPVEHVKRIKAEMDWGFPILGYGLTETNGVGCGNFNENYMAKPDSTGRASRPLVEVAILDDAGAAVPQGAMGEVCMRSICNFLGYWNNPQATRAAMTDDGYFRSGDLGYLDADGYLFIVDRKKDIIIRGGENIACIEVESAIYTHPDIAEASVFGLPCSRYGEVPGAVYVCAEGRTVAPDALRSYLGDRLAGFKIPAHFWQEEQPLPRLGTQKIDKPGLRARFRTLHATESETT